MDADVFNKNYDQLDDNEKKMWEAAYDVLQRGDRLFGTEPETTSHVGWALGVVAHMLKNSEHPQVFMMVEIGHDEEVGYSVRLILP